MELRSNRSRSKSRTSIDKDIVGGNHIGQTVIKTTRTTIKTTLSSDNDKITNINHNLESRSVKPVKMKNEKSSRKTRYKTSDYSSEDGDCHVSSTDTIDQNSNNQFLENMRRSVSRSLGSNVSALDFYRAAGDYWNKFPKTDYTYSPHSKDRTEIAPGVMAMPNMSRRSLHSYESGTDYITAHKQTNTESFEHEEVDYSSNSTYKSRFTTNLDSESVAKTKPRTLFSNNHSDDKYTYSLRTSSVKKKSVITRVFTTITSIFIHILSYISLLAYYVYKTQNSIVIWMGKKMHQATTRIMLWDTWLLQSSTAKRKMSSLLALCLIPLVLLGGWWLLSGIGPLLSGTSFNFSSLMLPSSPLVATTTDLNVNNIGYDYQNSEHDNIIQTNSVGDAMNVQTKIEEKIITVREKLILEPPKADEIAAELTSEQLQDIANSISHTLNIENQYNMDVIITKILENPSIQDVINNYNKLTVRIEESKRQSNTETRNEDILQSQQSIIDDLRKEIHKVRFDLEQLEKSRNEEFANIVAQLRSENSHNTARLTYQLNRCCHSVVDMERYITRILKDLLGAPHYLSTQKDISNWLHATFVAKQDLQMHLSNLTHHLKSDYDVLIESSGKKIMDKVMLKISEELNNRIEKVQLNMQNQKNVGELKLDSLTDEYIKKIVQDAIALYDADKTGLVDYALESAGGHILSTRCTESYQARTAVLSIFGIPLWYPTNTPRTVITPGMTPGDCWAFQNFPGFLLIKLAAPIKIEAFSLEHISSMLAANGKIDSAPKEFSVYGLRNETDKEPILLGKYIYDYNGPPLQYFASEVHGQIFDIVELRIHSNHGNPNYTCLYRFRVHGNLSAEPT